MSLRSPRAPLLIVLLAGIGASSSPVQAQPAPQKPMPPGLDLEVMDLTVDPCQDFYQYACGGWLKRTEIPADLPVFDRGFIAVDERNTALIGKTLEALAAGKLEEGAATPYAKKLGDFFAACMDEAAQEQALPALQAMLPSARDVSSPKALAATLGRMHGSGRAGLFNLAPEQDQKNADQVIAVVRQGGLGLPDRDYYLSADAKKKAILDAYRAYAIRIFTLLGQSPAAAAKNAQAAIALEAQLAKASLTPIQLRDPKKLYHRLERAGLKRTAPAMDWDAYFAAQGIPDLTQINIQHPPYFATVNRLVQSVKPEQWQAYLTLRTVQAVTRGLPRAFQDSSEELYERTLYGSKESRPRWKRCVALSDAYLGDAQGQIFVAQTFGADGKAKTNAMVEEMSHAYAASMKALVWMDEATRARALDKLARVTRKIGYPDRFRNYDLYAVDRASFVRTLAAGQANERAYALNKLQKPVDRVDWQMTPAEVNAYYEPGLNEIVFSAGILQPPYFDRQATDAVNFGAMGMVVGHELTHGFDDEGRQYDADGNLKDWWTPASDKAFRDRVACVKKQYDGYLAVDTTHLNGELTLGENVADLGGLTLAYAAAMEWSKTHPVDRAAYRFTPEQQVFLGFAQSWCAKARPEFLRVIVATDPHSPSEWRVRGPASNLETFRQAFQCKPGSPMVRTGAERCEVW